MANTYSRRQVEFWRFFSSFWQVLARILWFVGLRYTGIFVHIATLRTLISYFDSERNIVVKHYVFEKREKKQKKQNNNQVTTRWGLDEKQSKWRRTEENGASHNPHGGPRSLSQCALSVLIFFATPRYLLYIFLFIVLASIRVLMFCPHRCANCVGLRSFCAKCFYF